MMKRVFNNPTVKNAGWLMLGKVGQMVISLVVGLLTARYLGPANYGLINYAAAYTAFFMAFCTLGLNSVLVKEFIDHPGCEGEIVGSAMLMRAVTSFLSAGGIVLLVSILDAGEKTTIAVTALYSISLVFGSMDTINYWFQSQLKSKITALVTLAAFAVTSAYKVVLLAMGKSVEWFALATALDYLCVGLLLLACYRKHGGQRLTFSTQVSRRMLKKSVHFMLPSLMVAVYGYTDKLMLKQMLSEAEVGYYATATAICGMWSFVLAAIIDSVYPSIMSAHRQSAELFEKRNRQLYAIVFYAAVSISVFFSIFGELVVSILYGAQYLPAVNPLRVITWYTAFSYLGVARNAWIVSENKEKYLKYIYIAAAVSNVLMNLLLIPAWGAMGAAVASLLTQVITTLIMPLFIKEIRRNSVLMVEAICLKHIR